MSIFWIGLWTCALSLAWLLPNHFPPWGAFHSDAFMAVVVWIGFGAVIWNVRRTVNWDRWSLVVMAVTCIPWFQWSIGLIPLLGQAWISWLYLFGFGLAIVIGTRWEEYAKGQLAQAVFCAVGIAAVVSVGLQLHTWLGLQSSEIADIGSMGLTGNRPYANLAQPNLLASLLLWAMLSTLWAFQVRLLTGGSAVFITLVLLAGLALTQSRTGQLILTVLLLSVWCWRGQWRAPQLPAVATALYVSFWFLSPILEWVHGLMFEETADYSRDLQSGQLRLKIWNMLLSAVLERPWLGYGWTEITGAQVAVANRYPALGETFGHSHNLFLDLVLWNGLPIGLALCVGLIYGAWSLFKSAKTPQQKVIFLYLVVISIHAMLELPLHYAFFLIPVGILIGVMRANNQDRIIFKTKAWPLIGLWLLAGGAVAITVRDYFRVEESYNALRFEKARIGVAKTGIGKPPDVLVLTQLGDWIWAQRVEIRAGISSEDIDTMDALVRRYPTPIGIFNVAKAAALNQQAERAYYWLDRICKFATQQECEMLHKAWDADLKYSDAMQAIAWPNYSSILRLPDK